MSLPDRLLAITDAAQAAEPLPARVARLAAGGVRWISLREKGLSAVDRRALFLELRAAAPGVALWVHGDLTLADIADGVHLGAAQRVAGARAAGWQRIGKSAHSIDDLRAAAGDGADYATLSPIFESASKPGYAARGIEFLRDAIAQAALPVVALGGVGPDNSAACFAAGASAVAVMGLAMRTASFAFAADFAPERSAPKQV